LSRLRRLLADDRIATVAESTLELNRLQYSGSDSMPEPRASQCLAYQSEQFKEPRSEVVPLTSSHTGALSAICQTDSGRCSRKVAEISALEDIAPILSP
jgi:hypothetical protein